MTDKPIIGFRVEIIIEPDEGSFHAYCPALPGLHTSGHSEEDALENIRHAAMAYIGSLIKHEFKTGEELYQWWIKRD